MMIYLMQYFVDTQGLRYAFAQRGYVKFSCKLCRHRNFLFLHLKSSVGSWSNGEHQMR